MKVMKQVIISPMAPSNKILTFIWHWKMNTHSPEAIKKNQQE